MPYYIDILTPSTERLTIDEIRAEARKLLPGVRVVLNEGSEQELGEPSLMQL